MTSSLRQFIDRQQDEIFTVAILLGRVLAHARLTYASLKDLRSAMMRPRWILQETAAALDLQTGGKFGRALADVPAAGPSAVDLSNDVR